MIGIIAIALFIIWFVNHKKEAINEREAAEISAGLRTGEGYREDYIRGYESLPERQSYGRGEVFDGNGSGNTPWSRH